MPRQRRCTLSIEFLGELLSSDDLDEHNSIGKNVSREGIGLAHDDLGGHPIFRAWDAKSRALNGKRWQSNPGNISSIGCNCILGRTAESHGSRCSLSDTRESKVAQFQMASLIDLSTRQPAFTVKRKAEGMKIQRLTNQTVLGLEITVDDVLGVEVGHAASKFKGYLHLFPPSELQVGVLQPLSQVTIFDILKASMC